MHDQNERSICELRNGEAGLNVLQKQWLKKVLYQVHI